jgi:pimeloyl-ACP methyl ester carboxylesterase
MSKPIVYLVHGYNTDGLYMHQLAPYFPDYKVRYFEYKKISNFPGLSFFVNTLFNRARLNDLGQWLADLIESLNLIKPDADVHIIGHSNGVAIAYLASMILAEREINIASVSAFNGALNADTLFPCPVFNYYCTTDYTVKYLARLRPGHLWGAYGSRENAGAKNIKLDDFGVKTHSDFVDYLPEIMPTLTGNIAQTGIL